MDDTAPAEYKTGQTPDDVPGDYPKGIGGWLLLPLLHLAMDIGQFLWITASSFSANAAVTALGKLTGLQAAIGVFLLSGAVAIYALVCLIQFFRRKESVPLLMTVFYVLIVLKAGADLAALLLYPELQADSGAVAADAQGLAGSVVAAIVWISYFQMSERVSNTFVK